MNGYNFRTTAVFALFLSMLALPTARADGQQSMAADSPPSIGVIEQLYAETRALGDQIDILRYRDATTGGDMAKLIESYHSSRGRLQRALSGSPVEPLSPEDLLALATMRQALATGLPEMASEGQSAAANSAADEMVDCRYNPGTVAKGEGGYQG